jgi:formate C-acetyltransferase
MSTNHPPLESRLLARIDEPLAAGVYELRNATQIRRMARGLKRYAESVVALPAATAALYPSGPLNLWNLCGAAVGHSYTSGISVHGPLLRDKIARQFPVLDYLTPEGRERELAMGIAGDLENMAHNQLSRRFCVGGLGYTHSILNYQRILTDGLPEYGRRIERGLAAASTAEQRDFYLACGEAFEAVMLLLAKAPAACAAGPLREALQAAAVRPPETFHEAIVLLNFMFYMDGCDSTGALDRYLAPFYRRDRSAGALTPAQAEAWLAAFFTNVDANSGWHVILGGEGVPEEITLLCLRAQNTRRPNSGLKITPATGDALWEAAFDSLQRGNSNPAFYNDVVYRAGAVKHAGIAEKDLAHIAYGGCTEFMIEGKSNVGSIDAGVNLLRILDGTIKAELAGAASFDSFLAAFKADIRHQVEIMTRETNLNQEYKAAYRPQLIRTLFIDDCLDRGLEYNAGGARYNGGVINVAGIANAANSLLAIRAVLDGQCTISRGQLLDALATDFAGSPDLHTRLLGLPKFGNNVPEVDALAKEIVEFTFAEITSRRCWRGGGFWIPSTIMFVTYTGQGRDIDATPDGRLTGAPIADSCGPMQGTDRDGPTSMLSSTALLPQTHGLGTMILNLRVNAGLLGAPAMRAKLKALLKSYFAMGGMQVQITALDPETLKEAMLHPEQYPHVIVRIGGYTEYFNRLDKQQQQEVIKRTAHV